MDEEARKPIDWDRVLFGSYHSFRRFVFLEIGPPVISMIAVIGVLVVGGVYATARPLCHAGLEARGLSGDWGFWTGCMVTLNGQRVGFDEIAPVKRDGVIRYEPIPVVRISGESPTQGDQPK